VFDVQQPWLKRTQRFINFVGDKLNDFGASIDHKNLRLPRRTRSARTFPALIPWLRMDRLYMRGFEVEAVQVLGGPKWARLSDHSPLVADLHLKKP
jgi:endonuclease/exonuclease/phosphatase family metal-dependent hydrolase